MSGWREQMAAGIERSKAQATNKSGGAIKDEKEFKAISSGARTKAGGIPIMEIMGDFVTKKVCRYPIAGSGMSMIVCGAELGEHARESYCKACCDKAYYTPSRRVDNAAVKAGEIGTKQAVQKAEPAVIDLFGEAVA